MEATSLAAEAIKREVEPTRLVVEAIRQAVEATNLVAGSTTVAVRKPAADLIRGRLAVDTLTHHSQVWNSYKLF